MAGVLLAAAFSGAAFAAGDHAHHAGPGAKPDRKQMWQKSLARAPIALTAAFDASGRLWVARAEGGHVVVSSSLNHGRSFAEAVKVNPQPELVAADGENRPKIAIGPGGEIYVSWTQSLEVPFAGHVRFTRSLDGGRTFSAPITVNSNLDPISHRFDALAVDGQGRVWILWLDRRDRQEADRAKLAFAGISLYAAVSGDRGATFEPNRALAAHSCECCRIALALDTDGVPVALWRHVFGKNVRDHALARLDGEVRPVRVGAEDWAIDACPHHGPTLSIASDGVYHAAWYSGSPAKTGLYYARSADRGTTFGSALAFGNNDAQAGHPSVLSRGRAVVLAWKEFDGRQSVVRAMRSADGGQTWGTPRTLAHTAERSDHPQLISDGKAVFLAWNTAREGLRLIEVPSP